MARRALFNDPGPLFLDATLSKKKIVKEKFFFPLFPINRAIVSEKKIVKEKFFFRLFRLIHYNSAPVGQILIKKYGREGREEPLRVTPKKIVKEGFFFPLFPLNRYYSAPIGQILIKNIWACRTRRALSNDSGPAYLGAIVSENKIVKEKFFFPLFPLNPYNSAPIGQISIRKIWACRERRALSNDPGSAFVGAIVSEKKIVTEKYFFPLFLLNRYNSVPDLDKRIWARRARRALSNDPAPVFLGATLSEKKIVKEKFFFPLFSLNCYNSAPVGQIVIKKYGGVGSEDHIPMTLIWFSCYSFGEKNCKKKFFFPLFPLNSYNSAPIDLDKKIWACRARRALPSDPGSAFVGAIVSEKKIVTEKYFFALFPLNRYDSDLDTRIWARRARRALSNDPAPVFLGATLSENKIVKEKFFFPLFPLNRYNSAPIGQILIKKIWACRARKAPSSDPGSAFVGAIVSEKKIVTEKFFFPLSPLNSYNSVPIGHILIKKILACRARRALFNDPGALFLDATLSKKKIVKEKFFFPLFPINRAIVSEKKIVKEKFFFRLFRLIHYNSAPVGQILIKKYGRVGREEPLRVTPKKIVKEGFFFPLFPLNRYYSAPIGQILIKKIWACRQRRSPSNDLALVFLGSIVSGKKIILIKNIWACRTRRALSNDSRPAYLGAILSENKIVKEDILFPLFPLNRYNSAPIGQILIKKYVGVGREEPFTVTPDLDKRIWARRARRALSNDAAPVFLGATLSENKIVKEKFFFPLFPLNRYNSAPIGQILIKKIWTCRARRAPSSDPGSAFVGAIVSEKKIVTEKFFFPLSPLNSYNSVPIGHILIKKILACRARRAHSNDAAPVFLGATLSENKIVKEKFFFPLFPLNRYNSAPIGQILIKKIWTCRARRAPSSDPGSAFVGAIVSEKKIVTEKFFFPLSPLNSYNSVPTGHILIKKIWACRARRALFNDPGPVFIDSILSARGALSSDPGPVILGSIVSEKKIVKKKFFFPLFPLNHYNSASIYLDKKILACSARRAPSSDPGSAFVGAIQSEKKVVKEKFCFTLFPLNRYNSARVGQIFIKKIWACSPRRTLSNGPVGYNSAPIGQILIRKIWACRPKRSLSNNPGPVFLDVDRTVWACRARRALSSDPGAAFVGAIVSEKKIVKEKFFFPLFPINRYNSAPCDLDKKIWACWTRRFSSSDPCSAFVGAILSEKKVVKEKFCFTLFPLNRYNSAPVGQILIKKIWACSTRRTLPNGQVGRYNSAPIGQILIKKIWACRARRALSNDPGPVFLGATLSENKIVKEKFFFPLFPLNRYNSAPCDLDKKIWACRARRAPSSDPGSAFVGAILSEKKVVKEKFFFPFFPLNRYNSAPIGQILIRKIWAYLDKKIWACRARRAPSSHPGSAFVEKFCFTLNPLNRYNSARVGQILIKKIWACSPRRTLPNGQILIRKIWACRPKRSLSNNPGPVFLDLDKKKYGRVGREEPFPVTAVRLFYNSAPIGQILIRKIWACRPKRSLSNNPGPVFLGAIVSEKKIVKEKFFFPLFPLNHYNSASIAQIKLWACRARRALSSDPGAAFVGAIVSEKKIVKEKFFFPLFPINRYNSAPCDLDKKIWACWTRRFPSSDPCSAFVGAILSEKKVVKEKFCFTLFPLNRYNSAPVGQIFIKKIWACSTRRTLPNGQVGRYNSAPIGQILIKKIWACRARRALSNDPGPVFLGATFSENKIVKEKFFFPLFPLNRYNSAPCDLDKKIWACRARRAPSSDPGSAFVGAILSEKKVVKEKFFFPFFPLNRYNSAPVGQILIKKIWACSPRRFLSNSPKTCFPLFPLNHYNSAPIGQMCYSFGEKNCQRKFFFPLFPLNRHNSASIAQMLIKKYGRVGREEPFPATPVRICTCHSFGEKNCYRKIFFPFSHLNSYNSVPIGHILIKKIWPCRARRALSNDPGPVFVDAILSEKKIVKKKFFFPLFPINRYNSAPIGHILIRKICACRPRRSLSNDPGTVLLGAIVSEKKIVKKKFFFPLFPLNHHNLASICPILIKKIWACWARGALFSDPDPAFVRATVSEKKIVKEKFFFPLFPLNRYNSAPVVQILIKNIWACSPRKTLSKGPVGKVFFSLFPLNRYNSAPIGHILIRKICACRPRRSLSNDPGTVLLDLDKKIWACRTRSALSNYSGPAFLGAILSENKIDKEKFFFPLFPLNRYYSAPVGQILIKKIWACSPRRTLSNVPVGCYSFGEKNCLRKFFFPLFPLNRYNSVPIRQILIKKIWACRARRALSSDPGSAFVGAIFSGKKIVTEKYFFPLFHLNRYNSVPIGQILLKKIWPCRARRAFSNEPRRVFLGATLSEKKIVKEKFFFPLFPLNRYNSAPIGQILIRKICACNPRRSLSNDPGPVFLGAIVSEKKIFPLNHYNSAPIGQILIKKIWADRARRALSIDFGPAFVEKFFFPLFPLNHYNSASIAQMLIKKYGRVGREDPYPATPVRICTCHSFGEKNFREKPFPKARKVFFPLFLLNRYNSAPIGHILIRKICACRPRRSLSNDPGTVLLGAIVSEKKIVKKKFFFPFFPLNHYYSAPVGQIFIKKIWACSPRRTLSNVPVGCYSFGEKNCLRKFFFPLFHLNRYNSVPIGQILIRKIWACSARGALSSDPGSAFVGAIFSEKKIVTEKYFFPLFHLNRYNSVPIGQILLKKIWPCRARRAFSNEPGRVFLGATLSEKKIVKEKFFFPLFPLNSYNSAPIGQILISKICACNPRRSLSNDPGPVFLGAIVSEKKIFPLNRYNSAPIGQILIKKIWAGRARRALSTDPGPAFVGAIVSEKKIVKEKFFFLYVDKKIWACRARRALSSDPGPDLYVKKFSFPFFPLNRYNSAPVVQILIKNIWACSPRKTLSKGPVGKVFFSLFPLNRYNSAPIGHILIRKICACRPRRSLSNDPGTVLLGAIVSEKKIVKKKFFFPLFPLNHFNSASIDLDKKIWACRTRSALSNYSGPAFLGAILSENKIDKEKFFFPLFPLNRYYSAPVGQILIKKIWACSPRRTLSNVPVGCYSFGEKNCLRKFFFPLFPLNRYNSVPIGQILIKKIWACRARRALSSDPGSAFVGAIFSGKKIVTEKYFFPLFHLNRYNSVPIGQILLKKIWPCRARRAFSNEPRRVFLGATLSEKKIVKEKFFFPLFPLNRYNSAPIGQILIRKICACNPRRSLSNDPSPVFLGAIVSEKKIFPLNHYNSAPIGQILIKKIWADRARRALSIDFGPAFVEKFFFPLFPLNHYNSASIAQMLIKKYGRVGREDPYPATPVRICTCHSFGEKNFREKPFPKARKVFFPLFLLNRYNSAPIGHILIRKICACRPRRSLSNDPGTVLLGAIVSEKKIVKKKFFFPFFPLNHYYSDPVGQIFIKKIWACSPRRTLSNVPVGCYSFGEKNCLRKFFFPLFHLNRYNSVPIGQILIRKIWACSARGALSSDPGSAFVGAIFSEKKIVTEKYFFPLFHLNRYNSVPIGQILLKKIWPCRARRAFSNEPGRVFLGATLSEKKIVKEKFFFPLFPLNSYNSAPIGQILISKICACNPRRSLSNDPGPVFLGAIVSEKKIFPLNRYNSAPIGQILIKKIWAGRARRALSTDPGPAFVGAIVSEKKIVKEKFFFLCTL
ncbi:LOW QUALITY PROTEIN: hypothetical protein V1477_017785 [Vespula maculifrons]|uniref:Uncharacterized protein n=1 Tax=Vespula maculifrons TaxID=7453 RepID=A0ABD2B0H9_VESMC